MSTFTEKSTVGAPPFRRAPRRAARIRAVDVWGLVLFFVYFATYVASNASTRFESPTLPVMHMVMIFVALFSLATAPYSALFSLCIFSPIIFLYVLGSLPTYALMTAVFALALPVVSRALEQIVSKQRWGMVLGLLAIALIPALTALQQGEIEALWSSQYGRERLLMGYWHPKEAAASLAIPILLYLLMLGKAGVRGFVLLAPTFLWVVGSRNISLSLYLFIGLWRFPRLTASLLVVTLAGTALFLLLGDGFEVINQVTSMRLQVWGDALADQSNVTGDDMLLGNRLGIDSFYVELLVATGLSGILIFVIWTAIIYRLLGTAHYRRTPARPLLAAILFFIAFDSGITSTGNVFHITIWALATTGLFSAKETLHNPHKFVA